MPEIPIERQRPKPPSLLACISCCKSHLKCNGAKPVCTRCTDRRTQCIWTESRRGHGHRKPGDANSVLPSQSRASLQSPLGSLPGPEMSVDSFHSPESGGLSNEALSIPGFELAVVFAPSSPTADLADSVADFRAQPQETSDLIDLYYKVFHPAHPFLIPRHLSSKYHHFLPESLRAVMRFVAAHYTPYSNTQSLQTAAASILSANEDIFKVQGLLLFSMANFARYDNEKAGHSLQLAIQLALDLGLNKPAFMVPANSNPVLQESCRRAWWFLYIINGIVTAISSADQPFAFTLHSTDNDVPLPGHCSSYNNDVPSTSARSLQSLLDVSLTNDTFDYSSFAYAISAAHVLGNVLALPSSAFTASETQVAAIDASIANWHLSLPRSKRSEAISKLSGVADEMLFLAHSIISWSSIILHRPRSILMFIRNHYATTCTRHKAVCSPAVQYAAHTSKTMVAANAIVSLASLPRPVECGSPIFMCALTTAATVHLPAYAIAESEEGRNAVKERLKVSIAALTRISETWPRASMAREQVSTFAVEVLRNSGGPLQSFSYAEKHPSEEELSAEEASGLLQWEDTNLWTETTWMESLLNMTKDDEIIMASNG